MVDLTDNPYEEAYPEEVEKLRDDIDAVFEAWENGNLSRPGFSNELLGIAHQQVCEVHGAEPSVTSPNIFKQNLTIFITKVTQLLNSTEDGSRGFYNEAQTRSENTEVKAGSGSSSLL